MPNASDAARYRATGEHWRGIAERTRDEKIRAVYLELAASYDRLATLFERELPDGNVVPSK